MALPASNAASLVNEAARLRDRANGKRPAQISTSGATSTTSNDIRYGGSYASPQTQAPASYPTGGCPAQQTVIIERDNGPGLLHTMIIADALRPERERVIERDVCVERAAPTPVYEPQRTNDVAPDSHRASE